MPARDRKSDRNEEGGKIEREEPSYSSSSFLFFYFHFYFLFSEK